MKNKAHGVVMCGGLGSRLRPLTYYFQKTMLPVGSAQKPILEYILNTMLRSGIDRVSLLANYKVEQIMNYFGDGSKMGMKLTYVVDDPQMTGSGGALLNAKRKGDLEDTTLLIYYGDIITTLRLDRMLEEHARSGAVATLAVSKNYKVPVGVADMKGKEIIAFREKPILRLNVGVGIMALESRAVDILGPISEKKNGADLMGDLLPELLRRKQKVIGYRFKDFWLDVGSIEAYEKVDNNVLDSMFADMYTNIEGAEQGTLSRH
jgi:mannose-1-phosphate guanylyltransferase